MYLARLPDKVGKRRYVIRQSYPDGKCYRSRDLFDLGDNPSAFIIYPGGNSFYIDTIVEETIAAKGIPVSQDDLEPVFMPFLPPHIRRVIRGFDRRSRYKQAKPTCIPAAANHIFDRRRLHFLRSGRVNARELNSAPDRFYAMLQQKSRDEIEHDFITAERHLKNREFAAYTCQIFNLQNYFSERFARTHPEALSTERMDPHFIESLCRLNQDETFWLGSEAETGLRRHLMRYAIMYFDSSFPTHDPFQDILRDFMNRYRRYRPPESVRISLTESAEILGVTVDALKKMDLRMLTRQYRRQALKHHPDKGGNPIAFVKLTAAYEKLLKRKRHRG